MNMGKERNISGLAKSGEQGVRRDRRLRQGLIQLLYSERNPDDIQAGV